MRLSPSKNPALRGTAASSGLATGNGIEVDAFSVVPPRASHEKTFGPVIKRVVNDGAPEASNSLIDLDSRRLVNPPSPQEADWDWVVANGIDATGDMSAEVHGPLTTGGPVTTHSNR
ncbi:MAG: hypothetical protein H7A45_10590 [Verrucomicrobiales bacterium]|nr:hypothetical protein [Verrucomicrobiales bacterium]